MKIVSIVLSALLLSGCAVTPYKDLNLDTTSNFTKPTEGKAGVYVYQWKTGIIGSLMDVNFEIKGQPKIPLNTGEYGYYEANPGTYEYKLQGFPSLYIPVEFEANKNYFFRAALANGSDISYLVRDQDEIESAKKNISSGRYELYNID
ncbi:DUF2846 domain-containing protein [Massilia sp. Dwa41.01b]|uniref:DUF2846 domain-containing protein n=1 Tax=unclassified Massilia TaxID=2609279 RepID=UPI0015FFB8C0|nr:MULTISPECIES: DUF2846 domain-containing protein [unclassified Massilia]QNA87947.1 DUF2846 domain-containing protein [Massilia sp. Dwa41.01b]QNA98847.1 DUF2846 domain-containing protein [Massilia sp. Se16.2.3]